METSRRAILRRRPRWPNYHGLVHLLRQKPYHARWNLGEARTVVRFADKSVKRRRRPRPSGVDKGTPARFPQSLRLRIRRIASCKRKRERVISPSPIHCIVSMARVGNPFLFSIRRGPSFIRLDSTIRVSGEQPNVRNSQACHVNPWSANSRKLRI